MSDVNVGIFGGIPNTYLYNIFNTSERAMTYIILSGFMIFRTYLCQNKIPYGYFLKKMNWNPLWLQSPPSWNLGLSAWHTDTFIMVTIHDANDGGRRAQTDQHAHYWEVFLNLLLSQRLEQPTICQALF